MISHRNIVFDNIFNINSCKKYYSEYGSILASLNLLLPKIIITDNFINNLYLDFREIHTNDQLINDNIPLCYIYTNETYIDWKKINEPFIKIFNNINNINNIKNDIELISLRSFKDIIIIENFDKYQNQLISIINIYNRNKYCVYYTYENKVIIYSF
jgi:hypothetical protein